MESIGGSIIGALGAGSGINSNALADQLTELERSPRQAQIDSNREEFETQISDYGLIRSALSTLQDSANLLSESSTFNSKTASFSDSDAFIPVSLDEDVPVGTYTFEVMDIARSHSLATAAIVAEPTDAIGKGTMTISFGSWDALDPPTTFTQNIDLDALQLTIDDTNNSLNGLREAINREDAGVSASIINDGDGYRLLITAESGQQQQLQITVTEDVAAPGLSDFQFSAGAQNMEQLQAGQDATLFVNGLEVTRSTNDIDDVLEGFNFTLAKPDPGVVVSVTISEDKAGGEQAVRDFVETFNAFLEAIEPAVGFDEEADANGSLYRDPTAKSLQSQLRNLIGSSIPGVDSGFTALTNAGIRTELDGTLSIDEKDLRLAFDDNYDLVKTLFNPQSASSSDKITVNSARNDVVPGSYDVVITQDPAKGDLVGAASSASLIADLNVAATEATFVGAAALMEPVDLTAAGAYSFDIAVDGAAAVNIALPNTNYPNAGDVAAALQLEFDANGIDAAIVHNGSEFVVTSNSAGSNSSVLISNVVEDNPGDFGFAAGTANAGTGPNVGDYDFTITVDGVTSGTISIALGDYTDEDGLAAYLQAQINNDSTLKASSADVDVVWNVDHFEMTSRLYGDRSNVSVDLVGVSAGDFGLDTGVSSSGNDVAGTFDGVVGFGIGQVLLPKLDTDPYGISLIVQPGAASTTVDFSRGFGGELSLLIDGYLESRGILDNREVSLTENIDDLDEDQERLDRRMDAFHERLQAQFLMMERIISSLSGSGSVLDDIGDRLPFTAQR